MKTLYLECNMGAAGDMLAAALLELHPAPEDFIRRINHIELPHIRITAEKSVKCGICGTHVRVFADGAEENEHIHSHEHEHHHHHHSTLHDIDHIINGLKIHEAVKTDALAVYRLIAEAESHVHGCEINQIHFHEVGTLDAIADIVCVCMLLHELSPEKIIASPVHTGYGSVKCAHGILSVPAPATAYILRGIPVYAKTEGELCTPTGAALLKYFASDFRELPLMRMEKIGYGMGTKDFDTANCLRAVIGESDCNGGKVIELCCNLDDMTGEEIGFASERLFKAGALDVFTIPIGMKKSRPGVLLTCMCSEELRGECLRIMFLHTSTIGVREHISTRYTLKREELTVMTNYGEVRAKRSRGCGTDKLKAEYEDLARLARENDISVSDIKITEVNEPS
ncbi:MAG: nickel pincer cofactor biosynthesis protein LarC [Clostridia bacterium]|nr:nickel pincer cofactor biosynthesis protein LarC [Clostridia bacterium]